MFLKLRSKDSLKSGLNKVSINSPSLPFYIFIKNPWNLWINCFLLFKAGIFLSVFYLFFIIIHYIIILIIYCFIIDSFLLFI